MFPFTLSGPVFLVLYGSSAILILAGYWLYRRSLDGGVESPRISKLTDDPYKIAYLRGGNVEIIHVAIFNLADRGFLCMDASSALQTSKAIGEWPLHCPLDRELLKIFAAGARSDDALTAGPVLGACEQYRQALVSQRLILTEPQKRGLIIGLGVVLALIAGVAIVRLAQAITRGQHNVVLLLVLAVLGCWGACWIGRGEFTQSGSLALGSLRALLARLKARASALAKGGATNEALLLAAVFGVHALPAAEFPFVEQMFPRPWWSKYENNGGGGIACGSSCGISGCGGGGGGCGGCGG